MNNKIGEIEITYENENLKKICSKILENEFIKLINSESEKT